MKNFSYCFKQGTKNMMSHRGMTLASLCIITATILIMGVFMCLWINASAYVDKIGDSREINIYLSKDADGRTISDIEWDLKKVDGVSEVRFYSKEERLAKVSREVYGDDDLFAEGENPLRNSFVVKVADVSASDTVSKSVSDIAGVEEVVTNCSVIGGIDKMIKAVNTFGVCFVLIFMLLAFFIIFNTVKIAVTTQKDEIKIMRIIGATDGFVSVPYIIQGTLTGLIASIVAFVLTASGYGLMLGRASQSSLVGILPLVGTFGVIKYILPIYIFVGVFVGAAGSFAAICKILNKKDEVL